MKSNTIRIVSFAHFNAYDLCNLVFSYSDGNNYVQLWELSLRCVSIASGKKNLCM